MTYFVTAQQSDKPMSKPFSYEHVLLMYAYERKEDVEYLNNIGSIV